MILLRGMKGFAGGGGGGTGGFGTVSEAIGGRVGLGASVGQVAKEIGLLGSGALGLIGAPGAEVAVKADLPSGGVVDAKELVCGGSGAGG